MLIKHSNISHNYVHVAHSYEFDNTVTMSGSSGYNESDKYKLSILTDNNSMWMLTETTTPIWQKVGGNVVTGELGIEGAGGEITTIVDNGINYNIHTFITSGTFTVIERGVAEILIVAGGGGGGASRTGNSGSTDGAGGGGGGGIILRELVLEPGDYSVIVGTGGAGGIFTNTPTLNATSGAIGGNSSFNDLVAVGGGGGGKGSGGDGGDGGCGGGAGGTFQYNAASGASVYLQPNLLTGWGTAGLPPRYQDKGYGGMGAGGIGNQWHAGPGMEIWGATYAAGGVGCDNSGLAGADNTGDGGAGAYFHKSGKDGGSGIVKIRYEV